jgi:signal peptidase I
MFSFLLPKAVKQGRQFAQDARKLAAYKRDLWSDATNAEFDGGITALEKATDSRDAAQIEVAAKNLDQLCHAHLPKLPDAGWRENVEVFLVAIVIALGVRTYFLQPFTIPTGSMQPTLNGIIAKTTETEPPGALVQLAHTALYGRTYINTVAKDDEVVSKVTEVARFRFFTYTRVDTVRITIEPDGTEHNAAGGNVYFVHASIRAVTEVFGVNSTKTYRRGAPIARGYVDTGDHVFVDKLTYHFRSPRRSDVFVFNTENIAEMDNPGPPPQKPSQFYIKRLAGTPLDELRINAPTLFINGQIPTEPGFTRVMSQKDGYRGYSNDGRLYLNYPDAPFTVPEKRYFALGDNSHNSSDSRFWGTVPQENIMGRGVFVYWPFIPHWGLIR